MSNAYDEFAVDSDTSGDGNAVKQLRKNLEDAIKQLKEKDKQIAELTTVSNERTVSDYLAKHKVPEKFHKLAKRELKEGVDDTTFKAFLDEYGELWGSEEELETPTDPKQTEQLDAISKIEKARQEALNQSGGFKMPTPHELARMNPTQFNALMEQVKNQS